MADVTTPVDQHRIAVERHAREFDALRAEAALQRRAIERRNALGERALAEQVGRVNRAVSGTRPGRQRVIDDDAPTLEGAQHRKRHLDRIWRRPPGFVLQPGA